MSRGAVRDALNMLREEGLVSRVQGLGTFVVSPAALTRMVESHGMRPVPSGIGEHDLPTALQIIGPRFGEEAVYQAGFAFEEAVGPLPAI
jgi:DNA-binding FadR family transcriptional regulator